MFPPIWIAPAPRFRYRRCAHRTLLPLPLPSPRRAGLLLAALLCAAPVAAQSVTFSGGVRDAASGEALLGANVFAPAFEAGTVANAYGFFSLTLPHADSSTTLLVSYIGYEAQALRLPLAADSALAVALVPTAGELGELEVTAERDPLEDTQMSAASMTPREIQALPALLGEVDVLKALQLLPGVQSGSEGTSGLYVRGGGPDQNLILLDGAPVYNASHLFGFFSVFNADALRAVDLVTGGFPARYGGRLSSVLDIRMREGNLREVAGEGAVGLVASRLTVEGPILKDRAAFLVSGRRTYVDLLAKPFLPEGQDVGYYFYDLNAKAHAVLGPRDRVYLSAYTGRDRFFANIDERAFEGDEAGGGGGEIEDEFEGGFAWGNLTTTLRWNHVFSPKLFANASLLYSRYRLDIENRVRTRLFTGPDGEAVTETFEANYRSGIRDLSARLDVDFVPSPAHYVRLGGEVVRHRYRPGAVQTSATGGVLPTDTLLAASPPVEATEAVLYAEDDVRLTDRLKVNVGLHASGFWVRDEGYLSVQPRLAARYRLGRRTAVKASYARMQQYVHLLANSGIGLPTDLWLPATEAVPPQRAWQAAVGVVRTLGDGFEASAEGYYKRMDGLIEYEEGAGFFNTALGDWEEQVTSGTGEAYGLELLLKKSRGRTTGWVGYTLAWSTRRFEVLNEGRAFPYRYDRRHDVSVVLNHKLSRRTELAATWVFGTGPAVTLPLARFEPFGEGFGGGFFGSGGDATFYGERNGFRMGAYHRLDVAVNFHKETRWGERTITLGLYNAYNRKNPFFMYLDSGFGDEPAQFRQVSLFPVIPALSYRFRF